MSSIFFFCKIYREIKKEFIYFKIKGNNKNVAKFY